MNSTDTYTTQCSQCCVSLGGPCPVGTLCFKCKMQQEKKPGKHIHIEFYRFDHTNPRDPGRWEVRQNGSILNDAELLGYGTTEEEALELVRAHLARMNQLGYEVFLTRWEPTIQRYLQIEPFDAFDALLLKMLACVKSREEYRIVETLFRLPEVCDGCGARFANRIKYHHTFDGKLLNYCDACSKGHLRYRAGTYR